MTDELKACPFCASTNIEVKRTTLGLRARETARRYWVECECGAAGPNNQYRSGAVTAWNHRPAEGLPAGIQQALNSGDGTYKP